MMDKDRLRGALNRAFSVGVSPLTAAYQLERRLLPEDTARRLISSYGGLIGLWPGFSGDFLRRAFYRQALRRMHPSATISQGTTFSSDDIEIARGVYIGSGCIIGRCRIDEGVLVADRVMIIPGKHTHRFGPDGTLDDSQAGDDIPIAIGAHSWIGAQSVIMADVGARSIVGAGSVVVKPVPDDVLAAGNPARVIRRLREAPATPDAGER